MAVLKFRVDVTVSGIWVAMLAQYSGDVGTLGILNLSGGYVGFV